MSTDPGHSRRLRQRKRRVVRLLAGALLGIACAGIAAHPSAGSALGAARTLRPSVIQVQQQDIGASAAADAAARATGGKVINVKRGGGDGGGVYYVKVLLGGGKLRIVKVNARDGTVE